MGCLSGHTQPINQLRFAPSGLELVTVSDDHSLKVKYLKAYIGAHLNKILTEFDHFLCTKVTHNHVKALKSKQKSC